MTKFVIFFAAALAFQGILCAPSQQIEQSQLQQQQQQAQALLVQIQASSNNAINYIQNLQVQSGQYLNYQANDYAYNLQYVAYNLQQAIQNYQGYQYQQQIRQVYRRLSEIAYSVQQAINSQPNQLQSVLQNNLENSAAEAQRLVQILQKYEQNQENQQKSQQDQENRQQGQQDQQNLSQQELLQQQYYLNYQAIQVLYGILGASQRLQTQYQIGDQNQEQIPSLIQSRVSQLSNAIQNLDVNNEGNAQLLVNQAYQLSQNLGYIINRLQTQVSNYGEGKARNILQQVANKLSEIRGVLEQAAVSQQDGNVQQRIQQLQNVLKANINGAAVQIERLLELVSRNNQNQQISYLVNNVLADGIAAVQNLQSQLEISAQNAQNN